MATGYIVAPISKLPFLNIMTDVLLMQVPVETRQIRRIKGTEFCKFQAHKKMWLICHNSVLTLPSGTELKTSTLIDSFL